LMLFEAQYQSRSSSLRNSLYAADDPTSNMLTMRPSLSGRLQNKDV
jgi:hypothetical protein